MKGFFSEGNPKIELTVIGLDDKIQVPVKGNAGEVRTLSQRAVQKANRSQLSL
jgi:hypothetical protein